MVIICIFILSCGRIDNPFALSNGDTSGLPPEHADIAIITGVVSDATNGTPILGATVSLYDLLSEEVRGTPATTDSSGHYRIEIACRYSSEDLVIKAEKTGYLTIYHTGHTNISFSEEIHIQNGSEYVTNFYMPWAP